MYAASEGRGGTAGLSSAEDLPAPVLCLELRWSILLLLTDDLPETTTWTALPEIPPSVEALRRSFSRFCRRRSLRCSRCSLSELQVSHPDEDLLLLWLRLLLLCTGLPLPEVLPDFLPLLWGCCPSGAPLRVP